MAMQTLTHNQNPGKYLFSEAQSLLAAAGSETSNLFEEGSHSPLRFPPSEELVSQL